MRSEGLYVNEKSMTLAGIEPATFRFVAQHLNHCATAVPTPLHLVGLLFNVNYDARNHEFKILLTSSLTPFPLFSINLSDSNNLKQDTD